MNTLGAALGEAARLVLTLDPSVLQYAWRSLLIALVATAISSLAGVPLGVLLAQARFRGRRAVITLLNTSLSLPTVVVGLFVYALIGRAGPLGSLGLLYTVPGIIAGEVVLILPLLTALPMAAVAREERQVRQTALSLGANRAQALWLVVVEARFGILASLVAGFGRVIAEVGVATMLGGNADAFTRTLTTATVVEVDRGRFELALAIGLVLLVLSLLVNATLQLVQGGGRGR